MPQRLTTPVTDMQYVYRLVLDREENPIHVRLPAVEQLANLKWEDRVLRS